MGECEIEVEALISLVQEHPLIWDKTHEFYKHKNDTAKAWKGICSILVEGYSDADDDEKTQICKTVQRKWTNIRDTWMKFIRKDAELKKSRSGKTMKKYLYHDRLLFLQKNYSQMSDTDPCLTEANEIDSKHFKDDSNSQVFTLTFPQSPFDGECEMDVDLLLTLIEERPVIWDKTHEYYKHKKTTADSWKEICAIIVDRYSSADEDERTQICKTVQRKWTNLRDTWLKFVKKEAELKKPNSGRKHMKKYMYHDQMLFLQKNLQMGDMDANESCSQNFTDDSSDQAQSKAKQSNKRKNDQLEDDEFDESSYRDEENWNMPSPTLLSAKELDFNYSADDSNDQIFISQPPVNSTQILTSKQNKKRRTILSEENPEENRHMYFFKGILPSIIGFDEDQTLEFQAAVLSTIRSIKASRVDPNFVNNVSGTSFAPMQTQFVAANARSTSFGFDSKPNSLGQACNPGKIQLVQEVSQTRVPILFLALRPQIVHQTMVRLHHQLQSLNSIRNQTLLLHYQILNNNIHSYTIHVCNFFNKCSILK
ncbi:unnamed protein product, partial [Callosobruchus maculatus]